MNLREKMCSKCTLYHSLYSNFLFITNIPFLTLSDVKNERNEDGNKKFWAPSSSNPSPWPSKSSSAGSSSSQYPSSSHYPLSSQYLSSSQYPSSSSMDQVEDKKPVMGTQSEALSKSKCGNCGEIGHTRKWVKCPRYYSHEECLRREVFL